MTALFVIDGWTLRNSTVSIHFHCGIETFVEEVHFPTPIRLSDAVERHLDLLAVVAGVSYAKAFAPATISFPSIDLTESAHTFADMMFNEGMREFAFQNQLPLTSTFELLDSPRRDDTVIDFRHVPGRPLIPFGGGRDSCVVASALQHHYPTLLTIGENPFVRDLASALELEHVSITRVIDKRLLELNNNGAPNGHVPVTAINSLISLVYAESTGHSSIVMANEKSASEPTRIVDGITINHQFSKSIESEEQLVRAIDTHGSPVDYSSVLRDAKDEDISRAFALKCARLHHLFMSCNQAFLHTKEKRSSRWCANCPKCRGIFLSLAPFLSPADMVGIFATDMLNDPSQIQGFMDLMSDERKPFECVADTEEARQSMKNLIINPQWSEHLVVRECADIAASASHGSTTRQSSTPGYFGRDIERFIGSES